MTEYNLSAPSPDNFEQKCLCVLVLDVSASMREGPNNELNEGLQRFYDDIMGSETLANQLELSIVTFGKQVKTILAPSLVDNFTMPTVPANEGATHIVDGVRQAIETVNTQKEYYRETKQPYFRPWIILMTDGKPEPANQDVQGLAKDIHEATEKRKYVFFAVGVQGADMGTLKTLSSPSMPPELLKGLHFDEFFEWLRNSMDMIANANEGDVLNLPERDWSHGFQV